MNCLNPRILIPNNSSQFISCIQSFEKQSLYSTTSPDLISGLAISGITLVSLLTVSALFEIASKRFSYLVNLHTDSSNLCKLPKHLYFVVSRLSLIAIPCILFAQKHYVVPSDFYDFYFNVVDVCLPCTFSSCLNYCFFKGF